MPVASILNLVTRANAGRARRRRIKTVPGEGRRDENCTESPPEGKGSFPRVTHRPRTVLAPWRSQPRPDNSVSIESRSALRPWTSRVSASPRAWFSTKRPECGSTASGAQGSGFEPGRRSRSLIRYLRSRTSSRSTNRVSAVMPPSSVRKRAVSPMYRKSTCVS